ncbi:MAG: hypothetical protein KGJ88_01575 [Verrucomicrobiota bacterium]|nr:hypothetical protein [Verrucomicrobiota bacterium]
MNVEPNGWKVHGAWSGARLLVFLLACSGPALDGGPADSAGAPAARTNSPKERIVAVQLEMTNAWQQVEAIVNQPVAAYRRTSGYSVGVFSPGWFHPGAIQPDFNTVDVRKTQEFPYARYHYVSSDINPGMMFRGADLEFNAMTKYFYTNRTLPKHRLTEAEMLEINRLYRVIGHCQIELMQLEHPIVVATAASASDVPGGQKPAGLAATINHIRRVPRQTRMLYGGIAIGALIVLAAALRLITGRKDG